jgi:hypothetical protein
MSWMFPFNKRRRFSRHGETSIPRTLPNWKRATDVCIACFQKCLHSLFTLYVIYKQMRQYGHEPQWAFPIQPYTETLEEERELLYLRIEALEGTLDGLSASEERLMKLESLVTAMQQEIYQRVEALEGTLDGLSPSEEHLAKLESQVTHLQQAFQAFNLPRPAGASPEQPKHVLLTAQSFVARHGVDWGQMQTWIDAQAFTPTLSAEGLPDYLLTPDQQSMVIQYWKSRKIPFTTCEQCPHYILFRSQI